MTSIPFKELKHSLSLHVTETGGEHRPDADADFTFDYLLYCTINTTISSRHFLNKETNEKTTIKKNISKWFRDNRGPYPRCISK